MNTKDKSLNKQCFYRNNKMFCGIKSWNTCSNRFVIVLSFVYCSVDNMSFEVGPEIRYSAVSSRYCCYGNHTAGSKLI